MQSPIAQLPEMQAADYSMTTPTICSARMNKPTRKIPAMRFGKSGFVVAEPGKFHQSDVIVGRFLVAIFGGTRQLEPPSDHIGTRLQFLIFSAMAGILRVGPFTRARSSRWMSR
jgi:hypothetical protein